MNCREAESLIFAARDGALGEPQRATLAEHLGRCPACRELQATLDAAANAWRSADAGVPVPVVETEWHAIRRRIRAEQPDSASTTAWWRRPMWLGLTTATAALALGLWVGPRWFQAEPTLAPRDAAYVSYVKVFNTSDETMVYEDAESGWLVVWVTDDPAREET